VLERAINDYPGTVIFSAHDRFLIDRLANKVVFIGDGKARMHIGNWTDFEHWRENLKIKTKSKVDSDKTDSHKNQSRNRKTKPANKVVKKSTKPGISAKDREAQREKKMREGETDRTFAEIEHR
jgi:ATPase subunit of ABC transporter with duplicated ATPase domains